MIKLTLKDNSELEVEKGTTIYEVAKKISEGLARMATCGIVNGEVKDLRYELQENCELNICTFENSEEGIYEGLKKLLNDICLHSPSIK